MTGCVVSHKKACGGMGVNYQTQTYSYFCTHHFISIRAYKTAAERMLATSLSYVTLSSLCTFVPCYGSICLLELKAAVADLSKHSCRMLLL